MTLVTPTIASLRPYEPGKPAEEVAAELGIADAVKLASNENPLGPSPLAVEAMKRALTDVHRYPDARAHRLRERLAARHGVGMPEVLTGNGSNELLELVVRTFCTARHHVVFGEPSFVVYRMTCLAQGVPFSAVPLRDETHDLEAMAAAVTPQTRVMFIANPNNPTGTHVGRAALQNLLKSLPPEVIVVVDEAYVDYADASDYPDAMGLRGLRDRLIVLRTFSKIYGLAALRVGYAVGPAELLDYINRVRAPFNVGTLGQVAASAALDDRSHIDTSRLVNRDQRARLVVELSRFGLRVVPSQANFLYVDFGQAVEPLYERLLGLGVIIRPFGSLPMCARITVGTAGDNDRLLEALGEVLR
ncbi:MAG: histidinol-phosphate transaminase [Polyangiaceae bacterium]|nr:histidinol-phosphate transaminase [Polyangiaceae bacterium]